MGFKFLKIRKSFSLLINTQLPLPKYKSSIGWIYWYHCPLIPWIEYCNSDIKALLSTKNMLFVKMILLNCLDNIDALFVDKDANLVTGVHQNQQCQNKAAKCPSLRFQYLFSLFIDLKTNSLSKLVKIL